MVSPSNIRRNALTCDLVAIADVEVLDGHWIKDVVRSKYNVLGEFDGILEPVADLPDFLTGEARSSTGVGALLETMRGICLERRGLDVRKKT